MSLNAADANVKNLTMKISRMQHSASSDRYHMQDSDRIKRSEYDVKQMRFSFSQTVRRDIVGNFAGNVCSVKKQEITDNAFLEKGSAKIKSADHNKITH